MALNYHKNYNVDVGVFFGYIYRGNSWKRVVSISLAEENNLNTRRQDNIAQSTSSRSFSRKSVKNRTELFWRENIFILKSTSVKNFFFRSA